MQVLSLLRRVISIRIKRAADTLLFMCRNSDLINYLNIQQVQNQTLVCQIYTAVFVLLLYLKNMPIALLWVSWERDSLLRTCIALSMKNIIVLFLSGFSVLAYPFTEAYANVSSEIVGPDSLLPCTVCWHWHLCTVSGGVSRHRQPGQPQTHTQNAKSKFISATSLSGESPKQRHTRGDTDTLKLSPCQRVTGCCSHWLIKGYSQLQGHLSHLQSSSTVFRFLTRSSQLSTPLLKRPLLLGLEMWDGGFTEAHKHRGKGINKKAYNALGQVSHPSCQGSNPRCQSGTTSRLWFVVLEILNDIFHANWFCSQVKAAHAFKLGTEFMMLKGM